MNMRFASGHHTSRRLIQVPLAIALAVMLTACGGSSNRDKQAAEAAASSSSSVTGSGPALFITLSFSNTVSDVDATTYSKTFAVYVTDANGIGVPNQTLTLSAIPETYFKGAMTYNGGAAQWRPTYSVPAGCANEDTNKNGSLDAGEDTNGNGTLQPGNVSLVAPATVTTDNVGRTTFEMQYGKRFATWVSVRVTARGAVAGTESSQSVLLTLPISIADIGDATLAPPGVISLYGQSGLCSNPN